MERRIHVNQPLRIDELDQSLRANGLIAVQHAMQLRRMIYAKDKVTQNDAEILFRLDHACSKKDPAFAGLYIEALTDYFVWQTEPRGYVTPEQARYLIDNITRDGHVSGKTELQLLLNVVHWARNVPDELSTLVIESVRQSVLLSRDCVVGQNRPTACISAGDVAILRKALHAPAGERGILVSRREADMLFSLNEATGTGQNDPSWTEFFTLAIANHLLNPMNDPVTPTLEDAKARERWLDERNSFGSLLGSMGKALASGDVRFWDVWKDMDPTGASRALEEAAADREETRLRLAREQVDHEEAVWLSERILRDGSIDENERSLLAYLRKESPSIDPALQDVMKRAGL